MNDTIPAGQWETVLAPRPAFGDFFRGMALPFRAWRLIFAHPRLFRLSLFSAAITVVTLAAVVLAVTTSTDDLVGWWMPKPSSWYGQAGWYFLYGVAFAVLLVVGANTLPLLALAPLQDPLSEATEEVLGNFTAPPFSLVTLVRSTLFALGHTLARIGLLLVGHAVIALLHLIPGIGSLVWTVLATGWTALWLGGEYLAAPMARHFYPFREVRRVVRERLALTMGFGVAVYVILWVPVLNFFFVPMAIVGGTLLFRALKTAGALPPAPASSKVG